MRKILVNKLPRIIKARKKLEKKLNVKINNKGREIILEGDAEDEYIAEKVIDALDFGFSMKNALLIKERDYMFEIINIKKHTRRKNLKAIKARIIGTKGGTLSTLKELTKCFFEIKDNKVGIIGDPLLIKNAQDAVIKLIQGSRQANVYSYLEKHQVKPIMDLGLKKPNKGDKEIKESKR
ncbi:hypothetical protein GF378_02040 [Candidatus Pacearchaeota archaeon]|nr:hypothetical protein [Candidatus Pacearchaeota archaeon]